jgi:hypothetical protein
LYARQKVKIFYSVGFFFNTMKVRAIYLLPVWLVIEFYQLLFNGISNVAYVAHIGGLASGAALGFLNLKVLKAFDAEVLETETRDHISPLLEDALERIRQLDMEGGARLLQQVLARDPDHLAALTHLFNVYKTNPQDPRFHRIAARLLTRLCRDSSDFVKAANIYDDYLRTTQNPRLPAQLYFKMLSVLTSTGQPKKAEKIMAMFLRQKPDQAGLATALLKLAEACRRQNLIKDYKTCLQLVIARYTTSDEHRVEAEALKQIAEISPQHKSAAAATIEMPAK